MTSKSKLIFIKTIHTIIWIFFNVVLFYMTYEIIANQISHLFYIGIIIIEFVVLLYFIIMFTLTLYDHIQVYPKKILIFICPSG